MGKMYGKGRVFYGSFAHASSTWDIRDVQQMYFEALKWSLGLTDATLKPHAMNTGTCGIRALSAAEVVVLLIAAWVSACGSAARTADTGSVTQRVTREHRVESLADFLRMAGWPSAHGTFGARDGGDLGSGLPAVGSNGRREANQKAARSSRVPIAHVFRSTPLGAQARG